MLPRLLPLIALTVITTAAAVTPTPDQIRQLNALPDAQKRALARQFGVEVPANFGSSAPAQTTAPVIDQTELFQTRELQGTQTDNSTAVVEQNREAELDASESNEPRSLQLRRFEDLKPFGYNLFASQPTTFAPVGAVPLPENYVLGPGDQLQISYFGQEQGDQIIQLGVDGVATIPDLAALTCKANRSRTRASCWSMR